MTPIDLDSYVGQALERLSFAEQRRLAGAWIAFEVYSPATVPLRRIAAIAGSFDDCVSAVQSAGLDPREYEFTRIQPPGAF